MQYPAIQPVATSAGQINPKQANTGTGGTIQAEFTRENRVPMHVEGIRSGGDQKSAQALYTFIESLPRDPAPISLARLRARLNLKSPVFSQNQTVRRAMEQLRDIGYLDYTEIQRGRTKLFCIHYRRPKLKAPNDESAENPQLPAAKRDVSPEMAEKLAVLEKLGITLDDLEKLFKTS